MMRAIAQTMLLADIWICCKLIGATWMVLLDTNIQLFFFYCSYSLVGTVSFDMTGQNSNSVSQLASCYIVSPSWWELCIMFLNSHYVPVSKFTQTVKTNNKKESGLHLSQSHYQMTEHNSITYFEMIEYNSSYIISNYITLFKLINSFLYKWTQHSSI